jgi:hypothetical protein
MQKFRFRTEPAVRHIQNQLMHKVKQQPLIKKLT